MRTIPSQEAPPTPQRCVNTQGFSLHAEVRCAAHQRNKLVPRPRLHLIRFHGVLAPNAKLRPAIIPSAAIDANTPAADQGEIPHPSPLARMRLLPGCSSGLKRVFDIDIEQCPRVGAAP
ncbi:MAG: hypothetical protein ACREX9_17455 [Gammaproteobacteria bacterium]